VDGLGAQPPQAQGRSRFGAYGLALRGLDAALHLLVPADPAWPEFTLTARIAEPPDVPERLGAERMELRLRTGGRIALDLVARTVEYVVPRKLTPDELAHPFLAPAAAAIARSLGRESLHAAAFAVDGAVWALVGERGSGKSSTLAALARQGAGMVCDDMLVVEGETPFAGPRALDLRREPAEHLGVGEPVGVVGARERWRWLVPSLDGPLKLAGWIFLRWGESLDLRSLGSVDRLHALARHRGFRLPPSNPGLLVELAALPTFELSRPQDWSSLPPTCDRLLALAER